MKKTLFISSITILAAAITTANATNLNLQEYPNPSGYSQTYSTQGVIDPTDSNNLFFVSLGSNGRSCSSCHAISDGWTVTPSSIQQRFTQSQGLDPIFRLVDGANSPKADVSTLTAKQSAYSMLLNKGVIRIGLPIPSNANFQLAAVDDPYHYASASELSLFRRPMPATNLTFISAVMWDGRETLNGSVNSDLMDQANNATLGHAQASKPLTTAQQQQIVGFETSLYTAQVTDNAAGSLNTSGGLGGPQQLSTQNYYPGINNPTSIFSVLSLFNPNVFTLYSSWTNLPTTLSGSQAAAMASIARGQALFNFRPFVVINANGTNDLQLLTCSGCHDAPNVGSHSTAQYLNTGVASATRRTADLPLYTFQNSKTGATLKLTDPGRGLISGAWQDLGKFKVPTLRGLASRAPYFHDGSAATAKDVVNFYNKQFTIGLTASQIQDLSNFLNAL
jgi:cytochrome c peroxidase